MVLNFLEGPSGGRLPCAHRSSGSEKRTEVRAASEGSPLRDPGGLKHKSVCDSISHVDL